jgi:hypothetical protein
VSIRSHFQRTTPTNASCSLQRIWPRLDQLETPRRVSNRYARYQYISSAGTRFLTCSRHSTTCQDLRRCRTGLSSSRQCAATSSCHNQYHWQSHVTVDLSLQAETLLILGRPQEHWCSAVRHCWNSDRFRESVCEIKDELAGEPKLVWSRRTYRSIPIEHYQLYSHSMVERCVHCSFWYKLIRQCEREEVLWKWTKLT